MSDWPYPWEENFGPGRVVWEEAIGSGRSSKARADAVREVNESAALRDFSYGDKDVLAFHIYCLSGLASGALRELRECDLDPETLRSDSPPDTLTTKREIRTWQRYRQSQLCLDACRAARAAILRGDLVRGLVCSLVGGNKSQGYLASIGAARGKGLRQKGETRERAESLEKRDAAIVEEARKLKRGDPALTARSIAQKLTGTYIADGWKCPGVQSIRAILKADPSWRPIDPI